VLPVVKPLNLDCFAAASAAAAAAVAMPSSELGNEGLLELSLTHSGIQLPWLEVVSLR